MLLSSCSDSSTETVIQNDTNVVQIKNQKWMKRNLDVSTFRNGDIIIQAASKEAWIAANEQGTPAWCLYDNDPRLGVKYGKIYNIHALKDPRGLAPAGYRISTKNDWEILIANLGNDSIAGYIIAGKKLKSKSSDWYDGGGEDTYGFQAVPGGGRTEEGTFYYEGISARWYANVNGYYYGYAVFTESDDISYFNDYEANGLYVRCVKE